MKKLFLSLLALGLSVGSWAENTTTTVEQVTESVDVSGQVDYVITSTEPFSAAGSVNFADTEHAVVIFKYIKPSKVISDYLSNVYVGGETAVVDVNCQVRLYGPGAIVYPYGSDFKPLTCYTEEDYAGDSYDGYKEGSSGGYMLSLTSASLNNQIRSFKLKRGYMLTLATGSGGWGYSRCFIADKEDLELSSIDVPLNGKASSYRLFKWYNAQKKGLANDTDAGTCDALNVTSCYSFGLGWDMLPDVECVPHHIYEDWPSAASCGAVSYSPHLKTNNEPGNSSDDHPQDVETVLNNWQNLMRTGMRLCSESSHDGSMNHLKAFMDSIDARGWRCDIVDLHCYWASSQFTDSNLTWYSDYYGNGRPIWISEWVWGASWNSNGIFGSAPDGSNSFSASNQQTCYNGTKPILDVLNSCSRIERYYYWNSEALASKIYYNGQLSTLGEYYASSDMGSDLAYNAKNEFIPKVVYFSPGELTGTYTKKKNTYELTWTDPNGDLIDSIEVQCKLPNATRYTKVDNVSVKDKSSSSDISYTFTDTITETGIYYYQVVEYYNGGKKLTTNEVNVTVAAANNVGLVQYGQMKLANTDVLTTDIEAQDVAPYVVTGMVTNNNSSNGITNRVTTISKSSFGFCLYPWTLTSPVEISKAETVDYLVLPPDTVIQLNDDMMLISQKIGNVKGDKVEVLFPEAFPEGVTPVVVAQQNTALGTYCPVTVKVSDVTNTGFSVRLTAQESLTSSIKNENVNYFACTPGQVAIGEGKLLTVGRNDNALCGGGSIVDIDLVDSEGSSLHLLNPYIIAAAQTDNYEATSVFRQYRTVSDDDGTYALMVRRQVDGTYSGGVTNNKNVNGDYIGWFILSDDEETEDLDPIIVPSGINEVVKSKGFNVTCQGGCLWTDNEALRAYSVDGLQVPFGKRLPAGIYIVTDGKDSRKIVVR